jgi:membrane-associated phospholipid phosphatase
MSLVLLSALALLLLLLNYHFVSDIIAGTYLGTSITLALYYLSRLDKNP